METCVRGSVNNVSGGNAERTFLKVPLQYSLVPSPFRYAPPRRKFQKGLQLTRAFNDIFSKNDEDIGLTARVKHQNELTNPVPFKQRHRKIPLSMIDEVRNHIQQLLTSGVIRRSKSPWASNVVLVRKKNGQLRMSIDY
ncbi:uncharacterized protein LOC130053607 [Ostrea edulis]|uniref:uncharacterized protein LOC130053607 n=1 Tax=Ostrea edulis TaxID=37623 RepID=UPI0024AFEBF3|nr:uncharacterized protein LOC130053607 [Ostrea edulis]